ncbi:hypothetical protein D3C77_350310 [compost metagenome]
MAPLAGVGAGAVVDCLGPVTNIAGSGPTHQSQCAAGQSVRRALDKPGGVAVGVAGNRAVARAVCGARLALVCRWFAGRIVSLAGSPCSGAASMDTTAVVIATVAIAGPGHAAGVAASWIADACYGLALAVAGGVCAPGASAAWSAGSLAAGCWSGPGVCAAYP